MVTKPKKAKNEVKKKTPSKPKAKTASASSLKTGKVKPAKAVTKKSVELKHLAQPKIKPKITVKKKEAFVKKDTLVLKEHAQAVPAAVLPEKDKAQPVSPRPAGALPKVKKPVRYTDDRILTLTQTKHEVKEHPAKAKPVSPALKTEPVRPEVPVELPKPQPPKELELRFPVTVKDIAIKLQEKPSVIIKCLMDMRIMAGINQALDEQTVARLCEKLNCRIISAPGEEEIALAFHKEKDEPGLLKPRSPIVTLMGHVDHGKTSLLDAIRNSKIVEREHGGITQHIGAYRVNLPNGEITFLDTPGHEAFTAMRARGASITDIVVLVVAADDGIMPQTREAIDHAKAAGVSIIVALNKIDKPQANPDKVKKQLAELGLTPEDWDGKTITVPVSAKTLQGIDDLLEMILLEAQMLELKANPKRQAKGVVVEAKMSKGKGPVSTLLVQNGTLRINDNIIVGPYFGKVKAMFNDHGESIQEAGPGVPAEVVGITGIPQAGEQFFVIADEKIAKSVAQKRQDDERLKQIRPIKRISLEDLHAQIQEGKIKELKLILKADVQGSLEAIKETLNRINTDEIKLQIIHDGVGAINSSDVILAVASDALILGFNVNADDFAQDLAAKEGIDIRCYSIIYELANDIKAAIEGMLEPKLKKTFIGRADIRKVFKLSRSGIIAGCYVTKGKIIRSASVSLVRNGEPVFEGKISSLKRFKDDVREVAEGFECGISLQGYDNYMEGDTIDAFEITKVARKI